MYRTLGDEEKEARTTTITLLVKPGLRAQLEQAAERNERNLGGEVRAILREHLDHDEEEDAA